LNSSWKKLRKIHLPWQWPGKGGKLIRQVTPSISLHPYLKTWAEAGPEALLATFDG